MRIQSYTGLLKDIGPIESRKEGINIIYIDIGEKTLKNVRSQTSMREFLQKVQYMEGDTTLWYKQGLARTELIAAKLPNGRILAPDVKSQIFLMLVLLALPVIFFATVSSIERGFPLYTLAFCVFGLYAPWQQWKDIQDIRRIGNGQFP